jgi:teichuronic acid exporter
MSKFAKGIVWSTIERLLGQGINFIIGLVIARQLYPEDYGIFGYISIIIAISTIFVDSGFSTALIQKKNRDNNDYNTTFSFNCLISIVVYLIIFFLAPSLAKFFSEPILIPTTRIAALIIIINSVSLVHLTKLVVNLDFKKQSKISVIASLISGLIGTALAYNGYGIWSLIIMIVIRSVINTILLWNSTKWSPKIDFKLNRFKPLFSFSWKIMISALINTIFSNIYVLVIGKKFSIISLGFYTRASQVTNFAVINFTDVIQRVSFPILSEIQDEMDMLVKSHKKLIITSSYILFPILTLLYFISDSLIILILTDKWLEAAGMIKLLCLASLLHPIHSLNLNLLNIIGRSDLFLKTEIIKKALVIIILIITLNISLEAVLIGQIFVSILAFFINSHYVGTLLNYNAFKQLKDISKNILSSLILALVFYIICDYLSSPLLKILISSITGVIVYILISYIFNLKGFYFIREKLNQLVK